MSETKTHNTRGNDMKNSLKVKAKINCNTCGCNLNRVKTIKVNATTQEEAQTEASEKINNWKKSLKGTNCKICASIIKEVAA